MIALSTRASRSIDGFPIRRSLFLPLLRLRCRSQTLSNLAQRKTQPQRLRRVKYAKKNETGEDSERYSNPSQGKGVESGISSRKRTDNTPQDEPVVRWYHQFAPWSRDRTPADPENPDHDQETGSFARNVKAEVDRLDLELKEMEERPYGPLMKRLSPEDQAMMEKQMKRLDAQQEKEQQELQEYLPRLEIRWTLPVDQKSYLRELNECIKESLLTYENYSVRRKLWRAYSRCKAFLPPFTHLVPQEAWTALYQARAEAAAKDDAHWATHLIILIEDMRAAGVQLRADQIVMYIEALRYQDLFKDAITEWEGLRKFVEHDARLLVEYELLGVRLFTSQGDLATAERIASKHLDGRDGSESRILIPIMDTWMERRDEVGMRHAWALYITMKMQLGSRMKLKDYEIISAMFLNRGRTDLALAVFKDEMLHGLETGYNSVALYKRYLRESRSLAKSTTNIAEINELYLSDLTILPRAFENKFFYAKWLKKLLGEGDADAAATVVELMLERKISPDAKHINGILGCWYRSSSDADKTKAEQIGWSMINRRLNFVASRSPELSTSIQEFAKTNFEKGLSTVTSIDEKRPIPPATVETYALLLQYYTKRSRFSDISILHRAFELGQIQPNAYWINPFLWLMLRQHKRTAVWESFLGKFDAVVVPDIDTFECLWRSQAQHLKHVRSFPEAVHEFPPPRTIMKHMLSTRIREEAPPELYDTIIKCFMQSHDYAGTIVALHILRERLGLYPGPKTLASVRQSIEFQFLKPLDTRMYGERGHRSRSSQVRRVQAESARILKRVQEERRERMNAAGFDELDALQPEMQRKERLATIVDFLNAVMEDTSRIRIQEAASEMGLDHVNVVDYLRSEYRA